MNYEEISGRYVGTSSTDDYVSPEAEELDRQSRNSGEHPYSSDERDINSTYWLG